MRDHCVTAAGSSGWIWPNIVGADGRYPSDGCLNESPPGTTIEAWRIAYNTAHPQSSIGNQTLAAFAAASVLAMQRGETLRYPRGFVPRPVAQTEPIGSNDEGTQVPNE